MMVSLVVYRKPVKIYCVQVDDPTTDLEQEYWNICGCFLPNQYYQQYLQKNNLEDLSLGPQQCWYLPCTNSSIVPESNPVCPNNDALTNCVQDEYVTIISNNPANIQNDIVTTNQTITNCGSKTVEPINTVTTNNISNGNDMFTTPEPIDDVIASLENTNPPNNNTSIPPNITSSTTNNNTSSTTNNNTSSTTNNNTSSTTKSKRSKKSKRVSTSEPDEMELTTTEAPKIEKNSVIL